MKNFRVVFGIISAMFLIATSASAVTMEGAYTFSGPVTFQNTVTGKIAEGRITVPSGNMTASGTQVINSGAIIDFSRNGKTFIISGSFNIDLDGNTKSSILIPLADLTFLSGLSVDVFGVRGTSSSNESTAGSGGWVDLNGSTDIKVWLRAPGSTTSSDVYFTCTLRVQ